MTHRLKAVLTGIPGKSGFFIYASGQDGDVANGGDQHGGNGKSAERIYEMQSKFVEGMLSGQSQRQAAITAGYSPNTHPNDIIGHIRRTLEEHGLTADKLANEYVEGLDLSKKNGARERDLSSHSQYLKQLGWLLGANKQSPAVAVQINNQLPEQSFVEFSKPGGLEEAKREVLEAYAALRSDLERMDEEIRRREPPGVHVPDSGDESPSAHKGMDTASGEISSSSDRGSP